MKKITSKEIICICASFFKVCPEDVTGTSKESVIVKARHAAMYLLREYKQYTLKKIGGLLNKDHTAVIHALRCVQNSIECMDGHIYPHLDQLRHLLDQTIAENTAAPKKFCISFKVGALAVVRGLPKMTIRDMFNNTTEPIIAQ